MAPWRTLSCVATLAAGLASAQQPASPPVSGDPRNSANIDRDTVVVPVHHEPHHRQVFQYGTTRILDLQVPPGETSWFHTHEWPVLYVTLGRSAVRTQELGEDWRGGGTPPRAGAGGAAAPSGAPPAAPPAAPAAAPSGAPPARPGGAPAAAPRTPRATSATSYADKPSTHRLEN